MTDLPDMIKDLDWVSWQNTDNGDLYVFDNPKLIRFCMRVGEHLRRPTMAIIAAGQFVRLRHAQEYEQFELNRLDPENPDACLYWIPQGQPTQLLASPMKTWTPKYTKNWNQQQQFILQQQQYQLALQQVQLQQAQGIGSQYTISTTSNTSSPWYNNILTTLGVI